ncbi:MAG: RidA family protein [Proteobacteria bacterium]|nr:RidA family protein [Burkholderiales bacterium]
MPRLRTAAVPTAARRAAVEALLPVHLGPGKGVRPETARELPPSLHFARGIRAGRWVFATGQLATDYARGGIADEVLRVDAPLSGRPKQQREAMRVFDQLEQVLASGGTTLAQVVRSDQYFTTWHAVNHYHSERIRRFDPLVPPTTSILMPRLLLPDADLTGEYLALTPAFGAPIEPVYPSGLHVPSTSGFAPVVRAGDFVFIAGFMAAHQPGDLGGIAPEAKVPDGHLWKGSRIKLEADYALKEKIAVALDGAGATLDTLVKAQVYLRDMSDLPAFNEVWYRWFPKVRPAVSYIPTSTPGFAIADARLEINALALTVAGTTRRRTIDGGFHTGIDGQPAAVLAGDLLLCSALLAADGDGALEGCVADPRQPYFGSTAQAQIDHIVDRAQRLCDAAGTVLENMTRLQLFVTDLSEVGAACRALARRLPGLALPLSVVEVPAPLPVPACTIMADLWVYVPCADPA